MFSYLLLFLQLLLHYLLKIVNKLEFALFLNHILLGLLSRLKRYLCHLLR